MGSNKLLLSIVDVLYNPKFSEKSNMYFSYIQLLPNFILCTSGKSLDTLRLGVIYQLDGKHIMFNKIYFNKYLIYKLLYNFKLFINNYNRDMSKYKSNILEVYIRENNIKYRNLLNILIVYDGLILLDDNIEYGIWFSSIYNLKKILNKYD